VCFEARQPGCRSSEETRGTRRDNTWDGGRRSGQYHALFAGVTNVRNCGSKHPHRNRGVRFRTQCHARPQTQRAVQRRTQLAAERLSQAGTRCATRRPVHCQVEGGVNVLTDRGAEPPSLGAIGRRAEPRTRRAADKSAKPLIDGHIDGRIVLGIEPRSHPRIDPPVAGRSASVGLRPSAVEPVHRPRPADVFPQGPRVEKAATKHARRSSGCLPPPTTPVSPPRPIRVLFAVSFAVFFFVFSNVSLDVFSSVFCSVS